MPGGARMKITIHHKSPDYQSYRAACVRSLFNAEASDFRLEAELPLGAQPWQIGLIVGPSGSGKSSLGSRIWGPEAVRGTEAWPDDAPVIDAIAPDPFDRGKVPGVPCPCRLRSSGARRD